MGSLKFATAIAVVFVGVAACSGSGAASSAATQAPVASDATTVSPSPGASDAAAASATPAGAAVDPCGLLTAAELKTATGLDFGEGKSDDYGNCTWLVGDAGVNIGDGQVVINVQDTPLDTYKSTFPGGVDVSVSGHAAYWNPGDGLQSIWVDLAGRTLVISIDPVPGDGQAVAQALAELAVGRI